MAPAGRPSSHVAVPAAVRKVAARRSIAVAWRNALGGLTFECTGRRSRIFVKWTPNGSPLSLAAEAVRLQWARPFTPVPLVLDHGSDADGEWLVTAALSGRNAVDPRWKADPRTAAQAIGAGLRAFHEALPLESCPFTWSVEGRVAEAERRSCNGSLDPASWHADHREMSVPAALARIAEPPSVDRLVVCHGDTCAPNTLLDDNGQWTGHVDLGVMGVADRWADLAVATWSTTWNYGPGMEGHVLDAYGIDPDPRRSAYYRLLWDLT